MQYYYRGVYVSSKPKKGNPMKFLSVIVVVWGVLMAAFQIRTGIVSKYRFEKDYTQYWSLADKSSTIQAKQQYITQVVTALRAGAARGEFAANNAMWLKTTNNSFTANLTALESL